MKGRAGQRAYSCALARVAARCGLVVILGAMALLAWAVQSAAADQVVTVAPGGSAGPVAAEIGDVITIVGESVTFTDLDVPGQGVIPVVVVGTNPSPGSVSYSSGGLMTESISFSYGSVISPGDVPEQSILDAVGAIPLADATLQMQVADPPPPPPPPPPLPPPPVLPPPAAEPQPTSDQSPQTQQDEEPTGLPTELTGKPAAAPVAAGGAPSATQPLESSGGLSSSVSAPDGFAVASSIVETSAIGGFDELPMALSIPTLLAVLSIVVLAAGVGRLQLSAGHLRRRRLLSAGVSTER